MSLGLYFFIFDKKEFQIKLIMFITMVIISLLFFIFFSKLFEKICQRNVKKILFKEGKINILGQRNIIFDEEKIYIMMEYEENVIMYEKITEIKLSDEAVYLFTAPTIAIILPIRIFSDTKEKKELTDFLENKTNLTL